MTGKGNGVTVKSAARALDLIEYIVNSPKAPTFTEILNDMSIPKSSLSNLLAQLIDKGYIQYQPSTKTYYPGISLIRMSATCMHHTNLMQEVQLGTLQLCEDLGETVHAGVLDDRYITYISKHVGRKELSLISSVGVRFPAHATAMGKMLLTQYSEQEIRKMYTGIQMERFTERTISNVDDLLKDLKLISSQGYAIDNEEILTGTVCVAGPVYDSQNKMVCAISVTMPTIRAKEVDYLNKIIDKVVSTGQYISARLGRKY